jgi:hypothetical protein
VNGCSDPEKISGGLSSQGSVLSMNLAQEQQARQAQTYTVVGHDERHKYKNDFGSGQGLSIAPVAEIRTKSAAVLQAQTRERLSEEELQNSSVGNIIRVPSGPLRGPSPSKLRLQSTSEKHARSASGTASLRHLKEAVDVSQSPQSKQQSVSVPEWVEQSTDPVPAGIGRGPPTWVAEATKQPAAASTRGLSTPTKYNKTSSDRNAVTMHVSDVATPKGIHYDEATNVTVSPNSIADDSLTGSTPPDKKYSERKVKPGMSTRRLLGLKSSKLKDEHHHTDSKTTEKRENILRSKSSERVRFQLQGADHADDLVEDKLIQQSQASIVSVGDLVAEKRVRDAHKIALWLEQLGIRIDKRDEFIHAYQLTESNQPLTEFSNGILLGQLVSKLERLVDITGFTHQPKSPAQGLQNIRRVLDVLRTRNNRIKVSLLSDDSAQEIHAGNGDVLLELLGVLKKVYAHHI